MKQIGTRSVVGRVVAWLAIVVMTVATTSEALAMESPAKRYESYRAAVRAARSMEDLDGYFSTTAKSKIAGDHSVSELMLGLEKAEANEAGGRLLRQEVKGNAAVVEYDMKAVMPPQSAAEVTESVLTVNMVLEKGAWRIDSKNWRIYSKGKVK